MMKYYRQRPRIHAWHRLRWLCLLCLTLWTVHGIELGHRWPLARAQSNVPQLWIAPAIPAATGWTIAVPVAIRNANMGVATLAFSLDFDPTCLEFDASDHNGDRLPDSVRFSLPPQFSGSVAYAPSDTDGELDFVIADYSPPLGTLPIEGTLVTIDFTVLCQPDADQLIATHIDFASTPRPSFGNTHGTQLPGNALPGFVEVARTRPTPTPDPSQPDPVAHATPTPEPNSPPVAVNDTLSTTEFRAATAHVLTNDYDPNGDTVRVVDVTQGALGDVVRNADNSVTYTPHLGRMGEDLFSYTITDGRGGLSSASVRVTIEGLLVPPVAVDDRVTTAEEVPIAINVLANDYDPDATDGTAGLRVVVVGQPAYGEVQVNPNHSITYSPQLDYFGDDSFLYVILDADGGAAIGAVFVGIKPINDAPNFVDPPQHQTSKTGEPIIVTIVALDPDNEQDGLRYIATGLPPGLTINEGTGIIAGEIPHGISGTFEATITSTDGTESNSIAITWTVLGPALIVLERNEYQIYMPLLHQ